MKNAMLRFGYTCISAIAVIGISAGVMLAQTANPITVSLPGDVVAGASTLSAGTYTITDLEPASGNHIFVFRNGHGATVSLEAMPVDESSEAAKTSLILSKDGSALHLDKLQIEGSSIAYEFLGLN